MDPTGTVRLQIGTRPDGSPVFSLPDRGDAAAAEGEAAEPASEGEPAE
jgi:hypothetical protein